MLYINNITTNKISRKFLTVVHIVIHNGDNNGKNCIQNFKTSLKFRSSRPEVFCKKGVLKNFTKFQGKHQCHSLFFTKVAGLRQFKGSENGPLYCIISFYSKDIPTFNELVIKDNPVKK